MWRSAVQLRAGLLVEKYETAVETRVFRFFYDFGGIAQLVEHNICNVGVAGSNPTISTKKIDNQSFTVNIHNFVHIKRSCVYFLLIPSFLPHTALAEKESV